MKKTQMDWFNFLNIHLVSDVEVQWFNLERKSMSADFGSVDFFFFFFFDPIKDVASTCVDNVSKLPFAMRLGSLGLPTSTGFLSLFSLSVVRLFGVDLTGKPFILRCVLHVSQVWTTMFLHVPSVTWNSWAINLDDISEMLPIRIEAFLVDCRCCSRFCLARQREARRLLVLPRAMDWIRTRPWRQAPQHEQWNMEEGTLMSIIVPFDCILAGISIGINKWAWWSYCKACRPRFVSISFKIGFFEAEINWQTSRRYKACFSSPLVDAFEEEEEEEVSMPTFWHSLHRYCWFATVVVPQYSQ